MAQTFADSYPLNVNTGGPKMAYLRDEFKTVDEEYRKKNTFWRRWGALFVLLAFFIFSWGGQYVAQLESEKHEAEQHGQVFEMSDFWPKFWHSTLENWQSEWLQLAAQALLIAGLAEYIFRKENEEHYKTHLMIEELKGQLQAKK